MLKAPLFALLGLAMVVSMPGLHAESPWERLLGGSSIFDPTPFAGLGLDEETRFSPSSDGDSDLGEQVLLTRTPVRAAIRVTAETGVFWTDHIANITPAIESSGWFWANRGGLTWRPLIGNSLFVDAFAFEDIYTYDSGPFNFESTEAGIGLVKIFPDFGDLLVYGRYEFLYIHADDPLFGITSLKDHFNNRFHRLRFGGHKFIFSSPQITAYIAGDTLFDLDTDPSSLERYEYAMRLGYTFHASYKFEITAILRAAFLDYQNIPRDDWHYTTGLEASYRLSDRVRFFASVLYGKNTSNSFGGLNDYDAFQGGIGAGISASF